MHADAHTETHEATVTTSVRRLGQQVGNGWTAAADHELADSVSWRRLRTAVGVLGTLTPLMVWTAVVVRSGTGGPQPSISDYYHTAGRDVFVGVLVAIGVFLIFYSPYRLDALLTSAAGVLAVVVALVPTGGRLGVVHLVAAALLFLLLALVSIALFTRGTDADASPQKLRRNRVYRACGVIIIGCLVLAVAAKWWPILDWVPAHLFWLETVMLVAFGVSWYVKGESFPPLNDHDEARTTDGRPTGVSSP
jgi:hypothetical protein